MLWLLQLLAAKITPNAKPMQCNAMRCDVMQKITTSQPTNQSFFLVAELCVPPCRECESVRVSEKEHQNTMLWKERRNQKRKQEEKKRRRKRINQGTTKNKIKSTIPGRRR